MSKVVSTHPAPLRAAVALAWLVVGVIHLLPLAGLAGAERLSQLYGVDASEPNLALLLRHRAVLFGLLGALCVAAAFRPHLRGGALLAAWASVASFLLLAAGTQVNPAVARVVMADWIALAALVVATVGWRVARIKHSMGL